MTIDYSHLRSVTARQMAGALEREGFQLRRQKGSHRRYVHPDGRAVTLSFHRPSETFRPKTLRSIIEIQAQWTEEVLVRTGLLPKQ